MNWARVGLYLFLLCSTPLHASFIKKLAFACRAGIAIATGNQSEVSYRQRGTVWYRSYFLYGGDGEQKLIVEKQRSDGTWISAGHYDWQNLSQLKPPQ